MLLVNKCREAFRICVAVLLVSPLLSFHTVASKCPPIAQPDAPSWTSSLPASGGGLCNFKPLATEWKTCVEDYTKRRWSPLIAFGHVFQAN